MYVTRFREAKKLYITVAYITIARSKSVQKLDGMKKLTGVNSYVRNSYVQLFCPNKKRDIHNYCLEFGAFFQLSIPQLSGARLFRAGAEPGAGHPTARCGGFVRQIT